MLKLIVNLITLKKGSQFFCAALLFIPFAVQAHFLSTISANGKTASPHLAIAIKDINPKVLKLALTAHEKAKTNGVAHHKPYLTIIDYSLPSTAKRMWVLDIQNNKVMFHTHVAHGSGSGGNLAQKFSDIPGSYQTSLGLFLTGNTYQGKHGTSLTLHGLEKGINGNALSRKIVIHSANYVNDNAIKQGRLGRSWGCPALSHKVAQPIIQTIKGGSLIFAYYPDNKWLSRSKFLS